MNPYLSMEANPDRRKNRGRPRLPRETMRCYVCNGFFEAKRRDQPGKTCSRECLSKLCSLRGRQREFKATQ